MMEKVKDAPGNADQSFSAGEKEKPEIERVESYRRALSSGDTAPYMRDKYLELAREAAETFSDPEAIRELKQLIEIYESKLKYRGKSNKK